jgi:hypothetical protein
MLHLTLRCYGFCATPSGSRELSMAAAWDSAVHARYTWMARHGDHAKRQLVRSERRRSQRLKVSHPIAAIRFNAPGLSSRFRSVAIASQGRSCRRRPSWPRIPIPALTTSTAQWRGISVVARPIKEFGARFNGRRKRGVDLTVRRRAPGRTADSSPLAGLRVGVTSKAFRIPSP